MEPVVIAVGSNLGNRHQMLQKAADYLESISDSAVVKSSIWESEPIGPSKYSFLNAAVMMYTSAKPLEVLKSCKDFEKSAGRDTKSERWAPRLLDLDIITYGDLVIHEETLIIPHPEYAKRLFVLLPLKEVGPGWKDPATKKSVQTLIEEAPDMEINKTNLTW